MERNKEKTKDQKAKTEHNSNECSTGTKKLNVTKKGELDPIGKSLNEKKQVIRAQPRSQEEFEAMLELTEGAEYRGSARFLPRANVTLSNDGKQVTKTAHESDWDGVLTTH